MNTNILRRATAVFTTLMLFAALLVGSARAGTSGSSVVVNVPFDFVVAGQTLPAGEYLVRRSTLVSAEGLAISSLANKTTGVFVLTAAVQSNERQRESRLVFNRYGNQYFLSQLWTTGEASGRETIKSSHERKLSRELAKQGLKVERVAISTAQK